MMPARSMEGAVTRVSELSAERLAAYAGEFFPLTDQHRTVARLLYHALVLEPRQPVALRGLADLMDHDGLEYLAALVLEYALAPAADLPEDERRHTEDLRFELMWAWGFARHESGAADLAAEEFRDRTKFSVEEDRYRQFIARSVEVMGPPESAFRAIHTLTAAMGGLLAHEHGGDALLEEVLHPERFRRTPEYDAWLASDVAALDAVARETGA